MGHILFENFAFILVFIFGPLELKIHPKVCLFKNNTQTLPKQLQNNFEKGQKITFSPNLAKNDPSKVSQIVTENLKFRGI